MNTSRFKFIWKLLSPHRQTLISAFISGIVKSVCIVLMPLIITLIIDDVYYFKNAASLLNYFKSYSILFVGYLIILLLGTYAWLYINNEFVLKLKKDIVSRILRIPYSKIQQYKLGDLETLINKDTFQFSAEVHNNYVDKYRYAFSIILSFCLLYKMNAFISVAVLVLSAVSVFSTEIISRKIKNSYGGYRQNLANHVSLIVSYVKGRNAIISNDYHNKSKMEVLKSTSDYIRQDVDYKKYQITDSIINKLLFTLMEITIFYYGTVAISQSSMSVGQLIGIFVYLQLIKSDMTWLLGNYVDSKKRAISIDKVINILNIEEKSSQIMNLDFFDNDIIIKFDNVNFGYNDEKNVLDDISFEVEKGEKIGIVGNNGAGKSTLLNLMLGLFEPIDGDIYYNKKYLQNGSKLSDYLGVIPQDVFLFNGTLRYNIVLNSKDITDKQLDDICKLVKLDKIIETLPLGLDTPIDENINLLKDSDKQKIMIARVLLRDPEIIIIDEATSFLSKNEEFELIDILYSVFKTKTVFIVSHRKESLKYCERILEINGGKLCIVD